MVQIIDENRKPSFGEKLNAGVQRGLSFGQQVMQQQKAAQQAQQENQQFQKLTGLDISGIQDPKIRQEAFSSYMDLKNKEKVEELKGQIKENLLEQKFNKIGQILPKNKKSSPNENLIKDDLQIGEDENIDASNIPNETILQLTAVDRDLGKLLQKQKESANREIIEKAKTERSKFESDREYNSKRSDPIIAAANDVITKTPIRKGLINQQRRDIASGNTAGILPYLVDKTGLEFWRNPESARFKTASKQRFIENLSSLGGGARPNMFIEQQLVGAQAALGRDPEANETILDMEEFIDDMEFQRAKYIEEEAEKDREKDGFVKADVSERANRKMEKFAEERQEKMAYDIRRRHEDKLSDEDLTKEIVSGRVTPGTPLTIRDARILMIKNGDDEKKAQAEAKRLGFSLPKSENYKRKQ